ncbi:MAG: replication initiation protein [Syntrophomonadaceae bacterium]|jgi:plasmid replication initiation protein|nr:replication initiation protein [Syntrophomonadaceae bacterium]
MDEKNLIKKSNYFIMNSSYDLNLEEQKLILSLASLVHPDDEGFKPYQMKIIDIMELFGVETKTKYTEIPRITKDLMKKVFEIQAENKLIQVAWLSSAEYVKGSGVVELEFSPKLKPYMLQLKERFTQYQLANVLRMKSRYSPRLYEILKANEFKKQGYEVIEVAELRRLLKAEKNYPRYNDFKKRIIEQAVKEINELTDLHIEYDEIKTGRAITSLKFYIRSQRPEQLEQKQITITAKQPAEPLKTNTTTGTEQSTLTEINTLFNVNGLKPIYKNTRSEPCINWMLSLEPGQLETVIKNLANLQRNSTINDATANLIQNWATLKNNLLTGANLISTTPQKKIENDYDIYVDPAVIEELREKERERESE